MSVMMMRSSDAWLAFGLAVTSQPLLGHYVMVHGNNYKSEVALLHLEI